ncbi:hypothetical protein AVDCRST_MAG84-2817 [uncultured Microcoleus sp.]|uniref:Uncharacterized protein n=1 Tax=uncultured Microcoleus sp. TaxID=259945 RepID=A0A6J4M739_9CYAN|nr:hypothetical protein AVDCRST_MAG84-2817 [uncultured Microcoleus sp.]
MEIRSHFDASRKFDRTLTYYGNSIAQFRVERTDTQAQFERPLYILDSGE